MQREEISIQYEMNQLRLVKRDIGIQNMPIPSVGSGIFQTFLGYCEPQVKHRHGGSVKAEMTQDTVFNGVINDCPCVVMVNGIAQSVSLTAEVVEIIKNQLPALINQFDKPKVETKGALVTSICAIIDEIQNTVVPQQAAKNNVLSNCDPVIFAVAILDVKRQRVVGFGLGKNMVILEHAKELVTLKPMILAHPTKIRGRHVPCWEAGHEEKIKAVKAELIKHAFITALRPHDKIHLLSPACGEMLNLEQMELDSHGSTDRIFQLSPIQKFKHISEIENFTRDALEDRRLLNADEIRALEDKIAEIQVKLAENPIEIKNQSHKKLTILLNEKKQLPEEEKNSQRHADMAAKIRNAIEQNNAFNKAITTQDHEAFRALHDELKMIKLELFRVENPRRGGDYSHAVLQFPDNDFCILQLRLMQYLSQIDNHFVIDSKEVFAKQTSFLPITKAKSCLKILFGTFEQLYTVIFKELPLGRYLTLLAIGTLRTKECDALAAKLLSRVTQNDNLREFVEVILPRNFTAGLNSFGEGKVTLMYNFLSKLQESCKDNVVNAEKIRADFHHLHERLQESEDVHIREPSVYYEY